MPSRKQPAAYRLNRFETRTGISRAANRLAEEEARKAVYTDQLHNEFGIHRSGRHLEEYASALESMERHLGNLKGKTVLCLADSRGIFTRYLQSRGMNAVSTDVLPEHAGIARKIGNRRVVVANAFRLPFPENSADSVLTDHFLFSHYPDIDFGGLGGSRTVLKEIHRVLKPGGCAFIERSHSDTERIARKVMADTGFKVLEVRKIRMPRMEKEELEESQRPGLISFTIQKI
ncbi:MAG: class I SAM-dependent methyltransferase [Candidatus Diapherotrites archaeon]|nr:class I SAM-dependent methyltransferase [Candidatus Diapherotrites archaeon]